MLLGRSGSISGTQVVAKDPRAQASIVYTLGACIYTGRPVAPLALRTRLAQGLGPATRQPH